jgi:hypothetical protein
MSGLPGSGHDGCVAQASGCRHKRTLLSTARRPKCDSVALLNGEPMRDDRMCTKCAWRPVPIMTLLFVVDHIDRVNGPAKSRTRKTDSSRRIA